MEFGMEQREIAAEIRGFLDEMKKGMQQGQEDSIYALWTDAKNDMQEMFLEMGQIDVILKQHDKQLRRIVNMDYIGQCMDEIDRHCGTHPEQFCTSIMLLREYTDLLYRILDLLVSSKEVFSNETLEVLEYCYTSQDNEELRRIARDITVKRRKEVFTFPWKKEEVECHFDEEAGMYYVMEQGMRMYLPMEMFPDEETIVEYVNLIHAEQDMRSPHRYINQRMEVPEGAVVLDAGVAEGNFSISIIKKVKKLYLVECEPCFIRALQWTFKDYMDKIVIVDKFLTGHEDAQCTTVDAIMQGEPLDYLKMDIEGAEVEALQGAKKTMAVSPNLKCNVCVYHRLHDNEVISEFLKGQGMEVENTPGYMLFHLDQEHPWYPRKGLAQAVKAFPV